MAQSYVSTVGTLLIPGAYTQIKVEESSSGLAITGVLMLVGEAEAGADYSRETDISLNVFGPDQAADVLAKYKSGPLVDAFRHAAVASGDPNIVGSFSRAVLIKTNASTKASGALQKYNASTYATVRDKSYGKLGNLITTAVTAKATEAIPTTGAFTFLPPIAITNTDFRVDGGAALSAAATAQMTPIVFKNLVDALAGITATGGTDREVMGGGTPIAGNLAITVIDAPTRTVRVDFTVNFGAAGGAVVPGDTMWIPAGSAIAGGSSANCGAYIVTAATAATITARKLLDHTGTPNALTNPANVGAVAATGSDDVYCYAQVTISNDAGNPVDGMGKTLEVNELTSAAGLLSYLCYTLVGGAPVAVTWISKAAGPTVIKSATEYIPLLTAARQSDAITEELSAGGSSVLELGYVGTTASAAVSGGNMAITLVGGASVGLSPIAIKLSDYPTILDIVTYLNTFSGFKAAATSGVLGQQPSTSLDTGTYTFGSTHGAKTGRIKQDAYRFYNLLTTDSLLVELSAQPVAGVPGPSVLAFLAGGAKGASTDALIAGGIDALELVQGNFLVPLFSRDASVDIVNGLTESTSTYTINGIHAYCKSHVLKMSTMKRRKSRQAILSFKGTAVEFKQKSADIASPRCNFVFQDIKAAPAGTVFQFQPWMAAVNAAGMQAAGFYRPIVRKFLNVSGALQAANDWKDQNDTNLEDALLAGSMPIRRAEEGGYYWVSDQTTYGKDNNAVYNSLQAVYVADVIALTTAQRLEKAFVGKSIAEAGASMILSALESIMGDMLRLKLIAPSDDAPKGFKDAAVKIKGTAAEVQVNVKLAGALYFIPITMNVSQVTQSA